MLPKLANDPHFDPQSRVWIYTASRNLDATEQAKAEAALAMFTAEWTAHNKQLKSAGEVFANRYLILMVDETQAGASGCSIDKSVNFVKAIGNELGIDFLDRMQFGWVEGENIYVAGRSGFQQEIETGHIQPDTLTVNTLVQTKAQLAEQWLVPLEKSWIRRVI